MKKIRYEDYANHAEDRLCKYPKNLYYYKYEFRIGTDPIVKMLFGLYMNNDIRIKWDMER